MSAEVVIDFIGKDSFSGVLGNLGSIVTGLESGFNLLKGAVEGTFDFMDQFISSASESETAVTRLNTVLNSSGASAKFSSEQLQQMATAMMDLTGNSDEAEIAAETVLLRFENLNNIFPESLKLTNDISASLGVDLTTAARMVGMALDDPLQGLGRLNTQYRIFDDSQMEVIKHMAESGDVAGAQALIIQGLTEKFGGAAEAIGNTFAGQVDIAKEKLDNLKELIGGPLLTVLTGMLNEFNEFIDKPELIQFFTDLGTAIGQLVQGDVSGVDTLFGNLFQHMAEAVNAWVSSGGPEKLTENIIGWIDDLANTDFSSKAIPAAVNLVNALTNALDEVDWSGIAGTIDNAIAYQLSIHDWTAAGESFGDATTHFLTDGWGQGVNNTKSSAIDALGNAINSWLLGAIGATSWSQWADAARTNINVYLLNPIADAISDFVPTLVRILFPMTLGTDLARAARNAFADIGTDIQIGFQDGLTRMGFGWWVGWWDENVVKPVKAFLRISSPSGLFFDIGSDIVNGLINGITGMADWALGKIKAWLADVLAPFKDVLDFLGIDTSNIFGSSGGTTGSHDTGGTTTTSTSTGGSTPPTGGTSGNIFNFYNCTFNVNSMEDIVYDCLNPNPALTSLGTVPGGL